jgi:hypothetical protein
LKRTQITELNHLSTGISCRLLEGKNVPCFKKHHTTMKYEGQKVQFHVHDLDKMADIAYVNVGRAHHLTLNSDKNSIDICVNCIQLESQLDDSLLQLKSLQKVIDLLQQDSEQN